MKRLRMAAKAAFHKRILHDSRGAAMVEFAILAVLFIGMLIAVLDTGIMYFVGGSLDSNVRVTSRLIRTGQASDLGVTGAQFKAKICDGLGGIANCASNLHVDVAVISRFEDADLASPVTAAGTIRTKEYFDIGSAGDIMVVRASLPWTPSFNVLSYAHAHLADGRTLLNSTAIFRIEPYN